jgi:hypothetical protein
MITVEFNQDYVVKMKIEKKAEGVDRKKLYRDACKQLAETLFSNCMVKEEQLRLETEDAIVYYCFINCHKKPTRLP